MALDKRKKRLLAIRGMRILRKRYKKLFRMTQPLDPSVGIIVMAEALDGERQKLRLALRHYCGSVNYLKALKDGDYRYDINGEPTTALSDEAKQVAKDLLKVRYNEISKSKPRFVKS